MKINWKRLSALGGLLIGLAACATTQSETRLPATDIPPSSTAITEELADEGASASNAKGVDAGNQAQTDSSAGSDAQTTSAPTTAELEARYAEYEIITLLPKDGIPAIDNPTFLSPQEADNFYDADELVMGVEFGGEARAYSVPFLSRHEIVNDEVSGVKIAVTW